MRRVLLGTLLVLAPVAASAQQPVAPAPPIAAVASLPDTLARGVSPMGAFWRSLVLPGWGQAASGRRLAGAIFLGIEGLALGMAIKADRGVDAYKDAGSGLVSGKRQEREDWLVIVGFNHLFSALEAFVAAHLWDFPGDLRVERTPGGGYTGGITLPLPRP